MSWEYTSYSAKCDDCGHEGVCIEGDDDWGRKSTTWEGFDNRRADPNAVARKRADSRDSRPLCKCGSSNIIIGHQIKE